jgi:inorganic pyrophosphatase
MKPINATHYDYLPTYSSREHKRDHIVNAVIETPKGSCHKYALISDLGIIAFRCVLPDKLEWPYDYGFVPQTLAADGDPLDILVLNEKPLFSGCLIQVRVIGAIRLTKDGVENDRLIGVPLPSKGAPLPTDEYFDITDLPKAELDRIKRFLREYSDQQGHDIEVHAIVSAPEALETVKSLAKVFKREAA